MKSKLNVILIVLVLGLAIILGVKMLPSKSPVSEILGNWKTTQQYEWDTTTKGWKPGLILANGTVTEKVSPPLDIKFEIGGKNCPQNKENGTTYVSDGAFCYKAFNNILQVVTPAGQPGSIISYWKNNGSTMEMIIIAESDFGKDLSIMKGVLVKSE